MRAQKLGKISIKNVLLIVLLLCIILSLIIRPERYMKSARDGLVVFALNVLPVLFPFFFVTRLLTALGLSTIVGTMLKRPMKRIYHAPAISGYILFMSIMSGYPIGAKLLADAYENRVLDRELVMSIMPYTSLAGPLFVIGTLGAGILHDVQAGYIIECSLIAGALLNGIIYRPRRSLENDDIPSFCPLIRENVLENTINDSVTSILAVGGYITIFYIVCDILIDLNIANSISKIISIIPTIDNDISTGIPLGMVEMTKGILIMKDSSHILAKIPVISGIVAFGGLGIMLQSMTYLSRAKIKVSYYLTTKLTQSIITILISFVLTYIFLT